MRIYAVSIILLILLCFAACSNQPRVITRTELVEIEVCEGEYREISPELVQNIPKTTIPESVTWRELLDLLIQDRASLDIANARLTAIRDLNGND